MPMKVLTSIKEQIFVCVHVCTLDKQEKCARNYCRTAGSQISASADGKDLQSGLMDRWFVSSQKVNKSALVDIRAEA